MKLFKAGITSIQDIGRFGYQAFGMPTAGACDQYAYRIGNILVGNDGSEASLECMFTGPTIEFEEETVFAITGGDFGATLNGARVYNWHSYRARPGDILQLGGVISGSMGYISFSGGIDVPPVMGSRSTYAKGRIGGLEGRYLKDGDCIGIGKGDLSTYGRQLEDIYIPHYERDITVRVILGPQDDYFTKSGIYTFLNSPYEVTQSSDRMGYRLKGTAIEHSKGADIISDGVPLGAVQVPGDGQPIIMLADRQTTGGYTKIATVITADIPKMAQARPGDVIHFKSISLKDAYWTYRHYKEQFEIIRWYVEHN
ncbi:MAG: biotin-dependent carboxyltransferase family protein [Thermoanaerobacteraceae bacterium]|nr:biotin-dependent carboxyltransferase family protein [Thermoanaerobacteraceae bacterium]